jgi:hypothetical protein
MEDIMSILKHQRRGIFLEEIKVIWKQGNHVLCGNIMVYGRGVNTRGIEEGH